MILIVTVAILCGTVLVLGRRAERAIVAKWDADRHETARYTAQLVKMDERRVVVAEREVDLKERQFAKQAEKPSAAVQIPDDLQARIDSWGTSLDDGEDPFARDNERQVILALYAEYGDWAMVRTKLVPIDQAMAPRREGLVQ